MNTGAYLYYMLVLILVVALIFATAWIARRLGLGGRFIAAGGKRRLSVIEVLPLDAKRRLLLIRRDNTEHVVLLGLHADLVVESGIKADAPPDFAAALESARS